MSLYELPGERKRTVKQIRRLVQSDDATFDANGIALVRLGPKVYGETWLITRMVVTTTSVLQTTARVFLNAPIRQNQIDSTPTGNDDISDDSSIELGTTEALIFRWTGGTPATVATAVVYGTTER